MIQINEEINTKSGLTIPAGSILDVTPYFKKPKKVYKEGVFDKVVYDVGFGVDIYKNIETYKKEDSIPLFDGDIKEFNINFLSTDVNIKSLTSVDGILDILKSHIEDGDTDFSGVGSGKTEIIYP